MATSALPAERLFASGLGSLTNMAAITSRVEGTGKGSCPVIRDSGRDDREDDEAQKQGTSEVSISEPGVQKTDSRKNSPETHWHTYWHSVCF